MREPLRRAITGLVKLALKLTIALVVCISAVHLAFAAVRVRREVAMLQADVRQDQRALGKALAGATSKIWKIHGRAEAEAVIRDADVRHEQVNIALLGSEDALGLPSSIVAELSAGRLATAGDVSDPAGDDHLLTYAPVSVGTDLVAVIALSESAAPHREYVRSSILRSTLAALTTVAASGLVTLALGIFFVGRPIRTLVAKARRAGAGDLTGRIAVHQRDEIGLLSRELEDMFERLAEARERLAAETSLRVATLDQLRHADRLMTVGKLASGIAHELGTPLNVVIARAKMIASQEVTGDEVLSNARIIAQQGDRMTSIIRQLLDFARHRPTDKKRTDLAQMVDQTIALLEPMARKSGIAIRRGGLKTSLHVPADPAQIQQAVANVLVNAIQSMPNGGSIGVELSHKHRVPPPDAAALPGNFTCISVRDEGAGIPPELIGHIFDPFFTTKEVGDGTGLGLSVSYGIMRDHAGWIDVESDPGHGSRFSLYLPDSDNENSYPHR